MEKVLVKVTAQCCFYSFLEAENAEKFKEEYEDLVIERVEKI